MWLEVANCHLTPCNSSPNYLLNHFHNSYWDLYERSFLDSGVIDFIYSLVCLEISFWILFFEADLLVSDLLFQTIYPSFPERMMSWVCKVVLTCLCPLGKIFCVVVLVHFCKLDWRDAILFVSSSLVCLNNLLAPPTVWQLARVYVSTILNCGEAPLIRIFLIHWAVVTPVVLSCEGKLSNFQLSQFNFFSYIFSLSSASNWVRSSVGKACFHSAVTQSN